LEIPSKHVLLHLYLENILAFLVNKLYSIYI
jgi:hypothetical protein